MQACPVDVEKPAWPLLVEDDYLMPAAPEGPFADTAADTAGFLAAEASDVNVGEVVCQFPHDVSASLASHARISLSCSPMQAAGTRRKLSTLPSRKTTSCLS